MCLSCVSLTSVAIRSPSLNTEPALDADVEIDHQMQSETVGMLFCRRCSISTAPECSTMGSFQIKVNAPSPMNMSGRAKLQHRR